MHKRYWVIALSSLALLAVLGTARPLLRRQTPNEAWQGALTDPAFLPDNRKRDAEYRTKLVLAAIDARPGEKIADIGAGGGYFTFKLSRLVGNQGMVIATDCDPKALEYLRGYTRSKGFRNVVVRAVEVWDPGLDTPVDKVLMADLYSFRQAGETRDYFTRLHRTLAPGSKVVVFQSHSGVSSSKGWFGSILTGEEMVASVKGLFAVEKDRRFARAPSGLDWDAYLIVLKRI